MSPTNRQISNLPVGKLRELAARLKTAPRPRADSSPLVPLKPAGSQPPLFLIHPAGAMCYHNLALLLDADQPAYGLEEPAFEDPGEGYTPIEEMAARYVRAVKEVQPDGPYALGGWSLGGIVAFEMARLLEVSREPVRLLFMIDTGAPMPKQTHPGELRSVSAKDALDALRSQMGDLLEVADSESITKRLAAYFGLEQAACGETSPHTSTPEEEKNLIDTVISKHGLSVDSQYLQRLARMLKSHHQSVRNYHPGPYAGPILLLRATENHPYPELEEMLAQRNDPTLGWQSYTSSPVIVRELSGHHYTVMARSRIGAIADLLREYLNGNDAW